MAYEVVDQLNISGTMFARREATFVSSLSVSGELQAISGLTFQELPTYVFSNNQCSAGPLNTDIFDVFNAAGSGKIARISNFYVYNAPSAAITGNVATVECFRTSSVGTGGTALSAVKLDTNDSDIPAQITARLRPTGGAASSVSSVVFGTSIYTEETANTVGQAVLYFNPGFNNSKRFTLREGEGIKARIGPLTGVGVIGIICEFTLE